MNRDFQFRDKISVAIVHSDPLLRQSYLDRITHHPWFQAAPVEFCQLLISDEEVQPRLERCAIVLNAGVGDVFVPDVNDRGLLQLKKRVSGSPIVLHNPHPAAIGLALALKPLHDRFQVNAVQLTALLPTMGTSSRLASIELLDNALPAPSIVSERIQRDAQLLLGVPELVISAQSVQVPVSQGGLLCISVKLQLVAERADLITAWEEFRGFANRSALPSGGEPPLRYSAEERYPQARNQAAYATIGQLSNCPHLDFRFLVVPPEPIESTLRIAESLVVEGLIYW